MEVSRVADHRSHESTGNQIIELMIVNFFLYMSHRITPSRCNFSLFISSPFFHSSAAFCSIAQAGGGGLGQGESLCCGVIIPSIIFLLISPVTIVQCNIPMYVSSHCSISLFTLKLLSVSLISFLPLFCCFL